MAKITGRNFREAARAGFKTRTGDTGILVLRTDRRVLIRYTGDSPTGYSILGKVTDTAALHDTTLGRIINNKGWTFHELPPRNL